MAITAAESSAAGQSIYEYDKNGTVAKGVCRIYEGGDSMWRKAE
ncbi:hypothetical protein OBE_10881, partial [human gut metagenome]